MAGGMLMDARAKALAQFFRTLRDIRKAFEQRAQVQSGAHGEDRQAFSFPQVLQNL